ncbi:MAG: hypothetical protein AAGL89_16515 [Pseudomonadota bacterium]
MKYLAACLAVMATPAFADCPDPNREGPNYASNGADLIIPQVWEARAEGDLVAPCTEWTETGLVSGEMAGFLPEAPTAVFDLDGLGPHILQVRAVAECRPILAVRSGDGLWFFGETKNGKQEVTLWGAPDGPLQVWMGAETPEGCDGLIELETYDR